jgi:uncharacterized protein (TIGR03435 family)
MCTLALGLSIWFFPLAATVAFAQSGIGGPLDADAKPPAYDVVSVKPSNFDDHPRWHRMTADGISMNVTLKALIFMAYSIQTDNQISGLPGWATNAVFDVEAKMDADTAASLAKLPLDEQQTQRWLMLQALLSDRFGLKVHHETRELRVYKLVIAKGGSKMHEIRAGQKAGVNMGRSQFTGRGITIGSLVTYLSGTLGQPVVDKTGLNGNYDAKLQWTPDDAAGPSQTSGSSPDSGPSLFSALQEQLGLKLEPAKEPMDTIVVDHLERPSAN